MTDRAILGQPREADAVPDGRVSPVVRSGFRVATTGLILLAGLTWYSLSVPGSYFMILLFVIYGWLVVGGTWLALAIVFAEAVGRRRAVRDRWLIGGVAVIAATSLAIPSDWPLHVRFQLSRPALEAMAVEMTAPDAPEMIEDRSLGSFDAERIEPFEGGYRFLVRNTGFLDPAGLAYSPNGVPPDIGGEDRYYRFFGPWWIWIETW